MKRALALFLLLALPAMGQHAGALLPVMSAPGGGGGGIPAPDVWYAFNTDAGTGGTVDDELGGMTGLLYGDSYVHDGYYDGYTYYDGMVASNTHTTLNGATELTFSFWINRVAKRPYPHIFSCRKTDNLNLFGMGDPSNASDHMGIYVNGTTAFARLNCVSNGVWQHFVGYWKSGEKCKMWLDGVSVAANGAYDSAQTGTVDHDRPWHVGRDQAIPERSFNGDIDDLRVWKSNQTNHVAELYDNGNGRL